MTIFTAELKYFLRSPLIWLVAALFAFISAWSFLMAIELFITMQINYAGMSNPPTIAQGIIFPVIATVAKLSLLIVAIIAGLSFSRYSQNNAWSMVNAYCKNDFIFVWYKFLACFLICLLFIAPSLFAVFVLSILAQISLSSVLLSSMGMLLLLMWMISLVLFLSSLSHNSGFAILLSLIVLVLLWSLSTGSLDASWGKNWLQTFSPQYHFHQFMSSSISFASVFYFVSGIVLFLFATKQRLAHKRMILS